MTESRKEQCETCRFFVPHVKDDAESEGDCKRMPPVHIPKCGWMRPPMDHNDWCGEWQPTSKSEGNSDHATALNVMFPWHRISEHNAIRGRLVRALESELQRFPLSFEDVRLGCLKGHPLRTCGRMTMAELEREFRLAGFGEYWLREWSK